MKPAGRNDPCPCGSGLKYKRCCLGRDRSAFTAEERRSALARLTRYAAGPEFQEDHEVAQIAFWDDLLTGHPEDQVREVVEHEQSQAGYLAWFAFDFPMENGQTLVDLFLDREGSRLSDGEREFLKRMRESHMRLYEVREVEPDQGLRLVDLWTDQPVWVRERLATRQLARWDILAARLMPGAEGELVMEGLPYLYPVSARDLLLKGLRQAHRAFTRRFHGEDLPAFFKRVGILFHHFWLELVALRPLPTVVTAEGDPVIFAKVIFDMRDRAALEAALAPHPDLVEQDDGSYAWLEGREYPRRNLGKFLLERSRLVLETTSRQRAERGRRFLQKLAGNAVRFRATRYESVEQALTHMPTSPEPRPPQIPPEVEARAVAEYYERHYRDWLDRPLPALGNRTPHHAARLKTMRPKLVALLKEFENRSERMRREGRPAYDFTWMWQALGLDRP